MMADLLIGLGEVGRAVHEVIGDCMTYDKGWKDGIVHTNFPVRFLHICFPYSETFIEDVKDYASQFTISGGIIIYSTLPIGTCDKIGLPVAHSPIEGRHPRLEKSIASSFRWVGCRDKRLGDLIAEFWTPLCKGVRLINSPTFTEFLKLRSTSKYGINLVWTDYEAKVAKDIGMPFKLIKEFDRDYNDIYKAIKLPQFQRYILDPPDGKIGGHCIIPNAKILNEQYPDSLLDEIALME
jgi:hypothetical protein